MIGYAWRAVGFALSVALAGCAGGELKGDPHPEKEQRGLDNMMAPSDSPYVGGRPGAHAGSLMGPGIGMMTPRQSGRGLTRDEVAARFRFRLATQGDGRLKVGKVADKDKDTVAVELLTVQGYPAARYEVDRWTGITRRVK